MIASGITHFEWRTLHDNRVCEECESRDGVRFSWTPTHATDAVKCLPESECPGAKEGCRCYASPILEDLDEDDDDALILAPHERPEVIALSPVTRQKTPGTSPPTAKPARPLAPAKTPQATVGGVLKGLLGCTALMLAALVVFIVAAVVMAIINSPSP